MLFGVHKGKNKKNPGDQKGDNQLNNREGCVYESCDESEIQDQQGVGNIGSSLGEGTATGIGDTTNVGRSEERFQTYVTTGASGSEAQPSGDLENIYVKQGAKPKRQALGSSPVKDIKSSQFMRYFMDGNKSEVLTSPSMSVEHVASELEKLDFASSCEHKDYQGTIDERDNNEFVRLQDQSIHANKPTKKRCGSTRGRRKLAQLRCLHLGYLSVTMRSLFSVDNDNLSIHSEVVDKLSRITVHGCLIEPLIKKSLISQVLCAGGAYQAGRAILTSWLSPIDFCIFDKMLRDIIYMLSNEQKDIYSVYDNVCGIYCSLKREVCKESYNITFYQVIAELLYDLVSAKMKYPFRYLEFQAINLLVLSISIQLGILSTRISLQCSAVGDNYVPRKCGVVSLFRQIADVCLNMYPLCSKETVTLFSMCITI